MGELQVIFKEMETIEIAKPHFWAPIVASGQRYYTSDVPLPPNSTPTATPTSTHPPTYTEQIEDVCSPWSPDQGNLGNTYLAPIQNPNGKHNVILMASNKCHLLSKPAEVVDYLKPMATDKDWRKIDTLSIKYLINNIMHLLAQISI